MAPTRPRRNYIATCGGISNAALHGGTAGGLPRPTDLDCGNVSGGENAELVVGFRNSQVLAVPAGTYSGMLTITVSAP